MRHEASRVPSLRSTWAGGFLAGRTVASLTVHTRGSCQRRWQLVAGGGRSNTVVLRVTSPLSTLTTGLRIYSFDASVPVV